MLDVSAIRTLLVVPGHKPQLERKAREANPDMLVWDLEDSVPTEDKGAALRLVEARVRPGDGVRLNPIGTRWYRNEVERLAGKADLVFLPKYEGHEWGRDKPPWMQVPILETPSAVLHAEDIATDSGVVALSFGHADFMAHVGQGSPSLRHPLLAYARMQVLLAGLGVGVPVWHGPSLDMDPLYRDTSAFALAREAASLGFGGIVCVHPNQVRQSRFAWTLTPSQRTWAEGVAKVARANPPGSPLLMGGRLLSPANVRAALTRLQSSGPTEPLCASPEPGTSQVSFPFSESTSKDPMGRPGLPRH